MTDTRYQPLRHVLVVRLRSDKGTIPDNNPVADQLGDALVEALMGLNIETPDGSWTIDRVQFMATTNDDDMPPGRPQRWQ